MTPRGVLLSLANITLVSQTKIIEETKDAIKQLVEIEREKYGR